MPTKKINPADFEEKEKLVEEEEDDEITPKKITSDEGSDLDDAYLDGDEDDLIEGDSFDDKDSF